MGYIGLYGFNNSLQTYIVTLLFEAETTVLRIEGIRICYIVILNYIYSRGYDVRHGLQKSHMPKMYINNSIQKCKGLQFLKFVNN